MWAFIPAGSSVGHGCPLLLPTSLLQLTISTVYPNLEPEYLKVRAILLFSALCLLLFRMQILNEALEIVTLFRAAGIPRVAWA